MGERVLVTGAGLVGLQVAALEIEAGRQPVLFDVNPRPDLVESTIDPSRCAVVRGDVAETCDLLRAIKDHDVTRIVHTAAFPGFTGGSQANPVSSVRVNVLGTVQILELARSFGVRRVVVCSSSAMYASVDGGEDRGAPNREEAWPRPTTVYATTKQAAENLVVNYASAFGLDAVAVRFATIFGPPGGSGIGTLMMEDAVAAAVRGQPIVVQPGRAEWIYVKDAARGAHRACWAERPTDRIFNIGGGRNYDGSEMFAAFQEVFPEVEMTTPRQVLSMGVDGEPMDLARATEQLEYEVSYPLPAAIRDYRDWMVAHRPFGRCP